MKVAAGFSMADSRNLPKVDNLMLLQYMRENDCFNVAEIRGAKILLSSRDSYVDKCVGYVEVKRESTLCFVQGKITPEHRVRTKMYTVQAIIDEDKDSINNIKCNDCAASEGGCKHSICFIMWLIKRTEEPSVTSVSCYWAQPKLSEAVTKDKFVLAKEMVKQFKRPSQLSVPVSAGLNSFLEECKRRKICNSLIVNYTQEKQSLDTYALFNIMLQYKTIHNTNNINWDDFKLYADEVLTTEIKANIETQTQQQADSNLWHTLRQGRITASRIHEAIKCNTDGVLVQTILGGYKVPETKAIRRGKHLEREVIKQIEIELKVKIEHCGFKLITPFIGATPDGLCEEFCVEVKCPISNKTIEKYVKNGIVQEKFKAQVQIQMHAAGKRKALFCVADPSFETTKKYNKYWLFYDKKYVNKIEAELFWKKIIFDKLNNSATI